MAAVNKAQVTYKGMDEHWHAPLVYKLTLACSLGIHTETAAMDVVVHFQTQNSVLLSDCQFIHIFRYLQCRLTNEERTYKHYQIVHILLNMMRNMTEGISFLEQEFPQRVQIA